jgi:hypothetical protein
MKYKIGKPRKVKYGKVKKQSAAQVLALRKAQKISAARRKRK